jgi:hypothetical protein
VFYGTPPCMPGTGYTFCKQSTHFAHPALLHEALTAQTMLWWRALRYGYLAASASGVLLTCLQCHCVQLAVSMCGV